MPTNADDVELALPRPAAPSPVQSHGTVMVAVLSGFVVLAVLLWLSVRGVGPFTANVVSTDRTGTGAVVTVSVTNEGSKAGHGKCRVERITPTGDQQQPFQFISVRVGPHQTATQTVAVPLKDGARTGQVAC